MNEMSFIPEARKENKIDLSALTFDFISDNDILDYYEKKISELGDKDAWAKANEEELKLNKEGIAKAVEDGLIPDCEPETIWKIKIKEAREKKRKNLTGQKRTRA